MINNTFSKEQQEYVNAIIAEKEALEKSYKALLLQQEEDKFRIEYLTLQLNSLKHQKYGRRSEQLDKQYPTLFNYDVFNEAEDNASKEAINEPIDALTGEPKTVTFVATGKKKKNLLNRLYKLEVIDAIHDLMDEEKVCPNCGTELVKIGESETFKLKYIPAEIVKERHVYPTYKCVKCTTDDGKSIIIKAKYTLPFPKSSVGSTVVANIITDKFLKYVPLYRQEKLFTNVGLDISRQNLSNWFLDGAKELEPLV